MPTVSVFQRLPQHIAETIAKAYVSGSGIPTTVSGYPKEINAWILLYGISNSWRLLALAFFCSEVYVKILPKAGDVLFSYRNLPPYIMRENTNLRLYPKKVGVLVHDHFDSTTKEQLEGVMAGWPERDVFPQAHTLVIGLRGEPDPSADNGGAVVQNDLFEWLAQRIQTSMPKLQNALIEHLCNIPPTLEQAIEWTKDQPPNALFLKLFGSLRKLGLDAGPVCLTPNTLYFENSPGLHTLDYRFKDDLNFFNFVIQKSVSTLGTLTLADFPMESISQLVLKDNNTPIVYPRLFKLVFQRGKNYKHMRRARVDGSVAVFPKVRYLKWEGPYAFQDNTPFRGNNETLEYLNFGIDPQFAVMVTDKTLFPKLEYPKLSYITTDATFISVNQPVNAPLLVNYMTNLVSSKVIMFRTTLPSSFMNILDIVSNDSHAINITTLCLEASMLSLLQLLEVILRLPNMTDLTGYFEGLDPHLFGYPEIDVVQYLGQRYYPLSNRFKRWRVERAVDIPVKAFPLSAVAVAILCPNFVRLSTPPDPTMEIPLGVQAIIERGGFDNYAERLMDIFFHGH
ncbi:hypothetical protein EV175_003687 [Coemansia sp. RSA 1933]|nr:hypothetical protein EV175_003687 [Coemansia sp. RSA 1933]